MNENRGDFAGLSIRQSQSPSDKFCQRQNFLMRAVNALEDVDNTLKGLCACIEIMQMGAQHMANGEYIDDALGMIRKTLQNTRAELDEATSTVMQMRASA